MPEKAVRIINCTYLHAPPSDATLRLILERCAEETVDEERMRRVLEPVLRMIREGRFSRKQRALRLAKPLTVAAAVVVAAAALTQQGAERGSLREIPALPIPLSDSAMAGQAVSGRIAGEGAALGGLGGIALTLVAENGEIAGAAVTDEDGGYRFTNIPDGSYSLRAALAPGLALTDGELVVIDGPQSRKDIEIWVYEAGR